MSKIENPFLWWIEPMSGAFKAAAGYCQQMALIPAHAAMAPALQMTAQAYSRMGEQLEVAGEAFSKEIIPQYTREPDGIVCRPAAWN